MTHFLSIFCRSAALSRSSRKTSKRGSSFQLAVLLLSTFMFRATLAAEEVDMRGEWTLTAGDAASQVFSITTQSGGSFSGISRYPSGGAFGTITGTVSGSAVNIVNPYTVVNYTATWSGTLNESRSQFSGTWVSTWNQQGTFTFTRVGPKQVVQGLVLERERQPGSEIKEKKPVPKISISLTGTTTEGKAVSKSVLTDAEGKYEIEVVPGTYTVKAEGEAIGENGGSLSADSAIGGACTGTAADNTCKLTTLKADQNGRADFIYTLCSAPERLWKDKPLTGCPVVFVPGFLGSRIACQGDNGGNEELWSNFPHPRWGDMLLQSDGENNATNHGTCTASAYVVQGKGGLIDLVAGQSIYQTIMDFLRDEPAIGPFRWWAAPYDWRKSPVIAVPSLDKVVDTAIEQTGAKYVVLYGHSMGGLVMREYLSDADRAKKVVRVLTAGTPYWGAPKSHFSLLEGDTDTPEFSPLDIVTTAKNLQLLARNLQGLFFLNPSNNLGTWLYIAEGAFGNYLPQSEGGVYDWIQRVGGNPVLAQNARNWHSLRDGFPDLGIDYQVMIGAGSPTVVETKLRIDSSTWANVIYGNGDSTVPIRSASQGASDTNASQLGNVGIHYVCGVSHVALPGDPTVLNRIGDYLTRGKPIKGTDDKCEYSGATIGVFKLNPGAGNVVPMETLQQSLSRATKGRATSTRDIASLSLTDAARYGLIQMFQIGDQTHIVTDDRIPVTVNLEGNDLIAQVQRIGSQGDGAPAFFKSENGGIAIGGGTVLSTSGVTPQAFVPSKKRPVTKAVVKKRGSTFIVKLKASSPNGIAATYYKLGKKASAKRYAKSFRLTAAQLAVTTVSSVDRVGLVEKMHKVQ